jgi:hypothetical protein
LLPLLFFLSILPSFRPSFLVLPSFLGCVLFTPRRRPAVVGHRATRFGSAPMHHYHHRKSVVGGAV